MSIKSWVADLPSTNYKAVISIWLSVIVILTFTVCIALKVDLQTEAVYAVFIFLGGLVGADVTQFVMKRKTEIVTPPATMAENTKTTTVTAPVLTREDAQLTADLLEERQRELAAAREGDSVG